MCFTHGPKTSLLSLFCIRITSFAVFSFIRLKFFWFIPITLLLLLKSFAKYMLIEILITLFNNLTCLLKRRIKSKWWDYFSFRIRCQMVLFDQSSYYNFVSFIHYKSKQKVIDRFKIVWKMPDANYTFNSFLMYWIKSNKML